LDGDTLGLTFPLQKFENKKKLFLSAEDSRLIVLNFFDLQAIRLKGIHFLAGKESTGSTGSFDWHWVGARAIQNTSEKGATWLQYPANPPHTPNAQ